MNKSNFSKQATVLVVDDTQGNLAMMSSMLKNEYKVKIATSGETALKIASSSSPPDLILLDITMPGIDGYEVCRRLKRDPGTTNIPVIFVTARTDADEEKKGLELGAIDYISKPISPPLVMARIKNHLALKAMADFLRDQNDWNSAERLAFTLKGVSGNVGVTGLQQFADKLDIAIKERRAQKQDGAEADKLTTPPDAVIAQYGQALREEQRISEARGSTVTVKTVCDELSTLLIDSDAGAADVLNANADLLNAAFPGHYGKISDCVRSFNFEAALAELRDAAAGTTA